MIICVMREPCRKGRKIAVRLFLAVIKRILGFIGHYMYFDMHCLEQPVQHIQIETVVIKKLVTVCSVWGHEPVESYPASMRYTML